MTETSARGGDQAGGGLDPHYVRFLDLFNQEQFFEAHEVLEEIWLPERGGARDLFYKGLIQLAGALVHVRKQRRGPAISLLKLAAKNLEGYPSFFDRLSIDFVRRVIADWLAVLEPTAVEETTSRPQWLFETSLGWPKPVPKLLLEQ